MSSEDDYVEKAVALAGDKLELTRLRHSLRKSFGATFVHNEKRILAGFEAAIISAWEDRER